MVLNNYYPRLSAAAYIFCVRYIVAANYKPRKVTVQSNLSYIQLPAKVLTVSKHQSSVAEESSVQEPNQGVCTDVWKYHPCLTFLLLFVSRQKVNRS